MASNAAEATETARTMTVTDTSKDDAEKPRLRLQMPKSDKKVQWGEAVVDNEGKGKKSSKCCCVYKKPRLFGESSSEDDSDDENEDKCKGPKSYHKKSKQPAKHDHSDCNTCP